MLKYEISEVMWIDDESFTGRGKEVYTRKDRRLESDVAIYGWSRNGKSFTVYALSNGHIRQILKKVKVHDIP